MSEGRARFVENLNDMKIKTTIKCFITLLILSACSNTPEKVEEESDVDKLIKTETASGNRYSLILLGKNGDKTEQEVKFTIDRNIIDSLKIPEAKIKEICSNTLLYADWNVKIKPSYVFDEIAMVTYDPKDKYIIAFIDGTAENSYGVRDKISTAISFDLKGNIVSDKDGIPNEIVSF